MKLSLNPLPVHTKLQDKKIYDPLLSTEEDDSGYHEDPSELAHYFRWITRIEKIKLETIK